VKNCSLKIDIKKTTAFSAVVYANEQSKEKDQQWRAKVLCEQLPVHYEIGRGSKTGHRRGSKTGHTLTASRFTTIMKMIFSFTATNKIIDS